MADKANPQYLPPLQPLEKDGVYSNRLITPLQRSPTETQNPRSGVLGTFKRLLMATLVALALWKLAWSAFMPSSADDVDAVRFPPYNLPPEIANNMGPYSPRYKVGNFGDHPAIDRQPPKGCVVTQVNILERHGARFPTRGQSVGMRVAFDKLKRVTQPITDSKLEFITSYEWQFGVNDLLPFGRRQSFLSGRRIAKRYEHLIDPAKPSLFTRSTTKDRIAESARWFKHGFLGGSFHADKDSLEWPDVCMPVGPAFNNTLSVQSCEAADPEEPDRIPNGKLRRWSSHHPSPPDTWLSVYGPAIAKRLNEAIPEANLTSQDAKHLMTFCSFEAVLKDGESGPWCDVFTEEEWEANEYYYDLQKFWLQSHAYPFAATQGSGWVNELVARLTGKPVRVFGPINGTLDSDPATFPLPPNSPSIFADFTSDDNLSHMIAALGIVRDAKDLPPKGPIPKDRLFVASKIVPFGGNLAVEKLECSARLHHHDVDPTPVEGTTPSTLGDSDPSDEHHHHHHHHHHPTSHYYVRILLNDAVVPLLFHQCGHLGRTVGLCELDDFVKTQKFSLDGGNWDETCYIKRDT